MVYLDASPERVKAALACANDLIHHLSAGTLGLDAAHHVLSKHGFKPSLRDFAQELEALERAIIEEGE